MSFSGGCLCGAVRYEVSGDPAMVVNCHCKDCQKITGSVMETAVVVPKDAFKQTKGSVKDYPTTGQSGGKVHRMFCPECGSRLFAEADAMAGMWIVLAGSMDDASWIKPSAHIFTSHAQPWANIPADAVTFPKMPG